MTLAYIVACYFGSRRSAPQCYHDNPLSFVESHLYRLSEFQHSINSVIFVLNLEPDDDAIATEAQCTILRRFDEDPNLRHLNVSVLKRPNHCYSYGAWKQALNENRGKSDYTILLEDDYVPNTHHFDEKLLRFFTDDSIFYVCGLFRDAHPAISYGMLKNSVYEEFVHNGSEFQLDEPQPGTSHGYQHAEFLQTHFLLPFLTAGYKIADITTTYRVPFYNHEGRTVIYGQSNAETLISPVYHSEKRCFKSMHFRELTEGDIPFFNSLRSKCIDYLHSPRTYSDDEARRWFRDTKPLYYILSVDGQKVGYFRTSQYSELNRHMHIGCDIAPEYRGKGIGYAAYRRFIPFVFETFNLHKISLEVLSTNTRAIALYNKLGFVVEGTRREEVFKEGVFLDSILMSMLRNESYGMF